MAVALRAPRALLLAAVVGAGLVCALGCAAVSQPGASVSARAGAHVWTAGSPLLVLASADGGASWQVGHRASSNRFQPFSSVAFVDARHGWVVRRQGAIFATSDGGASWHTQASDPTWRLLDIACSDPKHAWVVGFKLPGSTALGNGLVLRTSDGGLTWREQSINVEQLVGVAFSDAQHGWAVGNTAERPNVVLATSDGGAHWNTQLSAPEGFFGVACSDSRHCWVVGASNDRSAPTLVVATTDGGAHWTVQPSGKANAWLRDVAFPDSQHGWAVGDGGVILATSDGGRSWKQQDSGTQFDLPAIAFSDADHGWAVVAPSSLLATGDGGRTWSVVTPTDEPCVLADVAALDSPSP